MPESERLGGRSDWLDLGFVERDRTPEPIIEMDSQLHLGVLSTKNTSRILVKFCVDCSHVAVHNWIQKADLRPDSETVPNQIAIDETVLRGNDEHRWLYVAVDPITNDLLHIRLFQTRSIERTVLFLRELHEKRSIVQTTFLVDAAPHIRSALDRLGLRFQVCRHGTRNSAERVFREV